jgi:redox-sensitive bicupin YhaK (pirin superfamily)
VINEDRVVAGAGFPTHPHRDMEIVSYVLAGALEHRDSMGNGSIIQPLEIQRMSAGTGVTHSEYNPARDEAVHFLQIWIVPTQRGQPPSYEQKRIALDENRGRLVLVAGPRGGEGAVTLGQDAAIHAGRLATGDRVVHALGPGRHAWLQVARGVVHVLEQELHAGDGAAVSGEDALALAAVRPAEVLLFDLG